MATHGQAVQTTSGCQKDDKPVQGPCVGEISFSAPESWQLNEQQQAFIAMFAADDHKKQ